jgi:hypothetical protein
MIEGGRATSNIRYRGIFMLAARSLGSLEIQNPLNLGGRDKTDNDAPQYSTPLVEDSIECEYPHHKGSSPVVSTSLRGVDEQETTAFKTLKYELDSDSLTRLARSPGDGSRLAVG